MLLSLPLLCASLAAASTLKGQHHQIQRRDDTVCTDLSVSSNNGDRKVAIVLDSSGSMAYNDPYDLRIKAGRALNDFLISSGEATGSQKADMVTVIDFDDAAYLDYPLGDPGNANSSFNNVDATGGTYIASGVNMAIAQLNSGGGGTDKRSAIVVFTDGEDYNPDELVDAINNATAAGIRVSFGFLDTSASSQPTNVLSAVKNSRGVYATITVAAGSQNFINYVLLNGLTYNDNPQGYDSQLLAGLAETHFITGSETVTLKYSAQQGERVNFTITSISAGFISVAAVMGGTTLNTTNTTYSYSVIDVTAPSSGELDLQITGKAAPKDAMFSVITNSNVPFKNCTVGVTGGGGQGGLSAGGKAGVGIGVTAALLGLGSLGGYFAYKHFMGGGGGGNAVPPSGGETNAGQFGGNGTEKMMAHTDVYPVDPGSNGLGQGSHGLPPGDGGSHGLTSAPNGGQAPMSGPPGPQNLAPPGQGGFAPPGAQGGLPPTNAPMSVPPTSGVPPTGGPAYPGSQPMAFIPPLVPPNALNSNNTAPKEKGAGGPQSQGGPAPQQGDGQYHDMKSYPPGNFGQQMAPGTQQPMGPNGSQTMSPGSPASQGLTGPAGTGAYPPAPGSQAPYGYGPGAQNMAPGAQYPMGPGGHPPAPGSQVPFGHGGESIPGSHAPAGTGSYPPAPSSQATPAPGSQYVPGVEGHLHNSAPGGYQNPMGQGNPGQVPGNNYQSFSGPGGQPMTGAEGYTHTMGGPGGHHIAPNPMGSDPNFTHTGGQPMTGADGYNHTMQSHQGTVGPDSYHQNGTMSPDSHQHGGFGDVSHPGQSMSPDSYHQGQHGYPSPQGTGSSPYSSPPGPGSTAPTSNYMTPQATGTGTAPSGGDTFHQHPQGSDLSPPDPNSQSHHPSPGGGDITHPNPDWNDYHDPDSCSCSEGPGPDSDFEGQDPTTPGNTTDATNPGFYMPGAPFRSADKKEPEPKPKHRHGRRRFPRLARSRVEKHHHHPWTGRDAECDDAECVFNRADHVCAGRGCECKCRDEECEVYKRRLGERRRRDGGLTGVLNAVS